MSDTRFDEFCGRFPRCTGECPLDNLHDDSCRRVFSEIDDFLKTEPQED